MNQANSIDQYLELLQRYSTYDEMYFRGQKKEYPGIPPSLLHDEGYKSNESIMYHEALRLKPDEFLSVKSPIEKLSKLQHYGVPTRLIDLTIDPLIALYFAVEDADSLPKNTNIENVNYLPNGNVRVYIQQGYAFSHTHTQVLSLVATEKARVCNALAALFQEGYGYHITDEDILKYASEPIFIKHSEELRCSNERLYKQRGAFFLCSNTVRDGKISDEIKSLDSIEPTMVIRIPFEYKSQIKAELDEKNAINKATIFPELPSVSDYLKEKYKQSNISVDGKYSIVEKQDISTKQARRLSLSIVLNELLPIKSIKEVVKKSIVPLQKNCDVIWVNVAKTGDDYIVKNWLIRGQWISSDLDEKYRPFALKQKDNQDFYWEESTAYSTLSDYYNTYAFDDDVNLFVYHKKIYEEIKQIYLLLKYSYQNDPFSAFMEKVKEHEVNISRLYMLFQDFGWSRNNKFNDFLDIFTKMATVIDDLGQWRKNKNINEKSLKYFMDLSMKDAEKHYNIIEQELPNWESSISITDEDYSRINPYDRKKPEFNYTPTIPISKDAIEVKFDVTVSVLPDKAIEVSGSTNLFDGASILLSIRGEKNYSAGNKAVIESGKFNFGVFSKKGMGLDIGTYKGFISLSLPSVQSKDFVKLAGIEYENLTGQYVKRSGIGPGVEFCFEFEVL